MSPTKAEQVLLRVSLNHLKVTDKLCVLAAVSGILEARIKQIAAGAEPTLHEFVTLDNLRRM